MEREHMDGYFIHSFNEMSLGPSWASDRVPAATESVSPKRLRGRRSQARRLGVTQSPPCSEFHAGTAAAECHHKFTTPNLRRALPTARKPASLVSSLSHSTVEMAITLPLASKLLFLLRFLTPGVMIMTRASQRGQRPSHYAHRCAHARPVLSSTLSSQGRTHVPSTLQTSCSGPSVGHLLPQ